MRVRFLVSVLVISSLISCSLKKQQEDNHQTSQHTCVSIREIFPGAIPFNDYTDSLLFFLYTVHNIPKDKILLAQSTCSDDILNTKNSFINHKVKGPFILGGLGGLPFTGLTGYNAFAQHVPDRGAALVFIGPHIGYSKQAGWGRIMREGQLESTSCCGATSHVLEKLQRHGILTNKQPEEKDYQEEVIEQLALKNKDEILNSDKPLITFTKLIYKEAERQITNMPLRKSNFKFLIFVVGIVINTDPTDPDYIWVDHMAIYDLESERELRIMEK
ncbi:MAG: hypothetical protein JNM78_15975 [Cyclobacteriaceae bacterium]|nr:hypothetical protein [Cyclobacteriaceae bacterium]